MLLKLSKLNSNLALTLGYFNPALNNLAQKVGFDIVKYDKYLSLTFLIRDAGISLGSKLS